MTGSVRFKIAAALVLTGAVAWAPAYYFLSEAENSREEAVITPALVVTRNMVKADLESSFSALMAEIRQRAISPATKNALHDFEEGVYLVSDDLVIAGNRLRAKYGSDKSGSFPVWDSQGFAVYEKAHDKHNPTFLWLERRYGLSETAIFEAETGFCIYSPNKGGIFGKTIIDPPARYKKMAKTVAQVFAGKEKELIFSGFTRNMGKEGDTAYLAAPIVIDGKIAGALVFTVTDKIIRGPLSAAASPAGYHFKSSIIRLSDNRKIAANRADSTAVEFASPPDLATTAGVAATKSGIAAFAPVTLGKEEYAILVESNTLGAKERAKRATFLLLATLGPAVMAIIFSFIFLVFAIFPKIRALSSALKTLAKAGEATPEAVAAANRGNEIGKLFELVVEAAMMIDQKDKEAVANKEALIASIEAMEEKLAKNGGSSGWRKLAGLSQKEAESYSEKSGFYEARSEELSGRLNAANEKLREKETMNKELVKSLWPRLKADLDAAIREANSAKNVDKAFCALLEKIRNGVESALMKISGEAAIRPERLAQVDIATCAKLGVESLRKEAEEKGVLLSTVISSTIATVRGDGEKIEAVIFQLLDNAIKFTPKGGEVTVFVSNTGSMVSLEVSDTGVSVGKSDREKIFERYYRGEGAEDIYPGGAGEGLSFCRNVIKGHDGKIGMRARKEGGSIFFFSLPVSAGAEQRSLF